MQNLNDGERQRVGKLLEEIYMSLTDKMKNLEKLSNTIEEKMLTFQPKLLTHLGNKCKTEYDWIKKNTKYIEKDGQVTLDIAEDEDIRDVANDNIKAFETCSAANDFGLQSYFEKMEIQNFNDQKNNESCLNSCVTDVNSKSDDQMKSCFSTCFTSYFNNTEQTIQDVIHQVSQTEKRF